MRRFTFKLLLLAATLSICAVRANASSITFDLHDHPLTHNQNPANPSWGFLLSGFDHFSFVDVHMTVDTSPLGTGAASFGGTVQGISTHEIWQMTVLLDNMRFVPDLQGNLDVPDDGMFTDLIGRGYGGGFVVWDNLTLEFTPNNSTTYSGPLQFIGKTDMTGNQAYMMYGYWLTPSDFPGQDAFSFAAWAQTPDMSRMAGDFLFAATPNPIPEPASMGLLGLALGGLGLARKRNRLSL